MSVEPKRDPFPPSQRGVARYPSAEGIGASPEGALDRHAIFGAADSGAISELTKMARRRHQSPTPFLEGGFWKIRVRENLPDAQRKRRKLTLAEASVPLREVLKVRDERLRPVNRSVITVGSAVNLTTFMEGSYTETTLPLLARGVQSTYPAMLRKHVLPVFGNSMLRDVTPEAVQRFFSALGKHNVPHPTIVKVRDAFSSLVRTALRFKYVDSNPLANLQLPKDKRGKPAKPYLSPAQFDALLARLPEPYATMVFVAVWTGLRVSELCALKWRNFANASFLIEQRFSRGDWSCTKTTGSAALIRVAHGVVERIEALKGITVEVRAGRAIRRHKAVKSCEPDDLVFQSVWKGKPMNESNILKRFIKPATAKLALEGIDWRALRRSCATWLIHAGVDPKMAQALMRHSRSTTTLEIYAQFVSSGQDAALDKFTAYYEEQRTQGGATCRVQ